MSRSPRSRSRPRSAVSSSIPPRALPGVHAGRTTSGCPESPSRDERLRLKRILKEIKPEGGGIIVRTAGWRSKKEFRRSQLPDQDVKKIDGGGFGPRPLSSTGRCPWPRLIRDLLTEDVDEVVVIPDVHREIRQYLESVSRPGQSGAAYKGSCRSSTRSGSSRKSRSCSSARCAQARRLHRDRPGEALVAIDVNTGRFVAKRARKTRFPDQLRRPGRSAGSSGCATSADHRARLHRHGERGQQEGGAGGAAEASEAGPQPHQDLCGLGAGLVEMTAAGAAQSPALLFGRLSHLQRAREDPEPPVGGAQGGAAPHRIGVNTQEKQIELRVSPEMAQHLFAESSERLAGWRRNSSSSWTCGTTPGSAERSASDLPADQRGRHGAVPDVGCRAYPPPRSGCRGG